jgi:uncharacterized phage-associated protein
MEQLRDVIAHLLRLAGPHGVNRTVLNKLVYFSELECWRTRGEPLTGTSFYRFKFGAWAPDVKDVTEATPFIEHKWFNGFYPEHQYVLKEGTQLSPLSDDAEVILRLVVEHFGKMTAAEIGRLSKQTEPMLAAPEMGESLDLSVVAPRRPRLRVPNSRLARAQATLDLTRRGTQEEIDLRDVTELAAWAELRRRAQAS